MNTDDFTQPLESVMRQERMAVYPLPLKIQDRAELFAKWCELNPKTLRSIELTALAIHQRGINNTDTPLLSRWLLERHPDLNIETRKSIYDTKKEG